MRPFTGLLAGCWMAAATAGPLAAATILERDVRFEITEAALVETVRLEVRLDEIGDTTAWSEYGVGVDDHITLEAVEARVLDANGAEVDRVRQRDHREVTSTGFGLHSSRSTVVVPFPTLDVGQVLELRTVRRIDPLFPTWSLVLDSGDPTERLEITLRDTTGRLRWELEDGGLEIAAEEREGSVVLTGRDIPRAADLAFAGDADWVRPRLRLVWSDTASWSEVGAWYDTLVATLEREHPEVSRLAGELTGGLDSPRERLEALTHHVQENIRYEAVEIGVGGWVPTPAHETLERGWGDCKDMSELLAELLRAAGIPAHLTLIRNGFGGAVDPNLPTTLGFNHCVVAVPAAAVGGTARDPVAGDYLILDPTVDRGGAVWLNPYLQDQWGLVADGDSSRLVRVPSRPGSEGRGLVVAGQVSDDGSLVGRAALRFFGARALRWVRDMASQPPDRIEESIRIWFEQLIPAVRVHEVAWSELEGEIPAVELTGVVSVENLIQGRPGRRRFHVTGLSPLPEPRVLDDRTQPVVLWPGRHRWMWVLELPAGWCPLRPENRSESNATGSVARTARTDDEGRAVFDVEIAILRPRYGPESFEGLRDLAVAASRAERRSVRLSCPE